MTISDWLIQRLQAEMNGPDVSLVRIEQLSTALRDVEVAALCTETRLALGTSLAAVSGLQQLFGNVTPTLAPIALCEQCGVPSVLERQIDGVAHRVCAEHVED